MSDPAVAIRLCRVGMRFAAGGVEALRQVDAEISAGSFVALVGPSGCGKSTILRLVSGLATPTSGRIIVDDPSPPGPGHRRRRLSYVLQDATLLDWRRVGANIGLPLELRHLDADRIRDRVEAALDLVGLTEAADLFPRQLSGGMRMRVSIARALVTDPGLLLMDEPFGALDEITRQRLNDELLSLWRQRGWTCIFVTHSVQEAVFLSQRVMVMSPRPGHIRAVHDVEFPYPRPRSLRAAPAFAALTGRIAADLEG